MPTFYDSTGKSHVLTQEIGRGGEGAVYFCEGNLELVAKIYHEPITEEKAEKLRWMAENNHEILQKVAAWVVETLHEKPDGKIVGFLMPNINAKEIHELYSLKSRRVHFPDANWHFLIHTATNVARAFYSLQKYDHVMGDVNHGNCVVLADGTVKLIDCDSYAIKADEKRYACEVGVATHLAPELQKASLSEIERLPKHDNFGLAVIIFQLLFLGRHPFSGNFLGEKDKTLEDCIREYRFAYGKLSDLKKVKQPPGTLSLSEVSPRVAELFERAFNEKPKRPTPKEWIEALVNLSENLEQCAFHPGHHYFNDLAFCPWCKMEQKTGLILFPFTIRSDDNEKPFNVYTIENLISRIDLPNNLPEKLPKPIYNSLPKPEAKFAEIKQERKNYQFKIVGGYFFGLVILMSIAGVGVSCFMGFLVMAVLIYVINDRDKLLRDRLNQKMEELQYELDYLDTEWKSLSSAGIPKNDLTQIRKDIDEYQKIQQKLEAKLTEEDRNAIVKQVVGKQRLIEREIEKSLVSLRSSSALLKNKQIEFTNKVKKTSEEFYQTNSNFLAVNSSALAVIAIILITIFTPYVGNMINEAIFPISRVEDSYDSDNPHEAPVPSDAPLGSAKPPNDFYNLSQEEIDSLEVPDKNISDEEISKLEEFDRAEYANNLFIQALNLLSKSQNLKAENKLRFSIRLHKNSEALNELGIIFYNAKKYEESLDFLKDSMKLNSSNNIARIYVGLNYMKLERYEDAISIFTDLTKDEGTNLPYYNLGLAYKELKKYEAARGALIEAIKINPSDVDSYYELGIVYHKLNDIEGFNEQYSKLLDLDEEKAKELLKNYELLPKDTVIIRGADK